MTWHGLIAGVMVLSGSLLAVGQATQPSQPAEADRPVSMRHAVTVPPGFEVIEIDQRRVIAAPEDRPWVEAALAAVQPTTRPTTLPADVVERLIDQRAWLAQQLATDLLIDPAAGHDFIETRALPALQRMESAEIPLFILAITHERLKELIKAGWSDPRFYYNRAADQVMIQPQVRLNFDRPMDDILLAALLDRENTAEQKRQVLIGVFQDAEQGILEELSVQSQQRLQLELLDFVEQSLMDRVDWKADQVWLRLGLVGVLSGRYAARITGLQPIQMVAPLVIEPAGVKLRAANIDLLHPTDPQDLRRGYASAYFDAMRRKSVAVVWDWLLEARPDAVSTTLRAMMEQKPPDGPALVRLIREQSGVDLSDRLGPR